MTNTMNKEQLKIVWSSPIWFFIKMHTLKRFKPEHYSGIQNIGHSHDHGTAYKEYKKKKRKKESRNNHGNFNICGRCS